MKHATRNVPTYRYFSRIVFVFVDEMHELNVPDCLINFLSCFLLKVLVLTEKRVYNGEVMFEFSRSDRCSASPPVSCE